ncbi:cell wall hydrolase [Undibacterium sp. 5I1]|nr:MULTISPECIES: cell wall hydrolase [unclassified Undibacterium]MDY7537535.1 cell wall hydrolase [Undibacterium sp. 5I1]MEB0231919.1 cell wall hydrolase [Undibacterium sp. 10I3]MEB0256270.1 cell wall hydrolase [Undibacterium sp. 5I1]
MILTTAALCLAINIYQEARGEPILGQYAVASVTMNRAKEPDKVCKTVLARKQFSWTTKLVKGERLLKAGEPKDKDAWRTAQIIAKVTLEGRMMDMTKGATHYHADYVRPYWCSSMKETNVLGRHIFYKVNQSQLT